MDSLETLRPVKISFFLLVMLSVVFVNALMLVQKVDAQELEVIDVYVEGYDPTRDYDVCGGSPTNENMYSCVSFRGVEFDNYKGTFEYDLKPGERIFACVLDQSAGRHSCRYDTESSPGSIESFVIDMRDNVLSTGLPEVLRTGDPQSMEESEPLDQESSVDKCVMLVMCPK